MVVTEGSKYLCTFLTCITQSYSVLSLFVYSFNVHLIHFILGHAFYSDLCMNSLQSFRSLILFCSCVSALFLFSSVQPNDGH